MAVAPKNRRKTTRARNVESKAVSPTPDDSIKNAQSDVGDLPSEPFDLGPGEGFSDDGQVEDLPRHGTASNVVESVPTGIGIQKLDEKHQDLLPSSDLKEEFARTVSFASEKELREFEILLELLTMNKEERRKRVETALSPENSKVRLRDDEQFKRFASENSWSTRKRREVVNSKDVFAFIEEVYFDPWISERGMCLDDIKADPSLYTRVNDVSQANKKAGRHLPTGIPDSLPLPRERSTGDPVVDLILSDYRLLNSMMSKASKDKSYCLSMP